MKWSFDIKEQKENLGETLIGDIDGFVFKDGSMVLVTKDSILYFEGNILIQVMENPMICDATIDQLIEEVFGNTMQIAKVLRNITVTIKEGYL